MRRALLIPASIAFIGIAAANANAQEATTPQAPAQPPAASPDATPKVQRINVVDVSELPQDTQKQVEQVVAKASAENLKQLRTSIEATPEAKAALDAKGATAAQVVATAMGTDGTLTLITKKSS
ncbi:MAG: hypothetical protein WBG88_03705 [Mesorhizobium sp.]